MGFSVDTPDKMLSLVTFLTLAVATSYSSTVSGNKVTCPEGWVDGSHVDMGCLLMHHPELNHKVHTWPKSDEFCREFGDNTRMVEVHTTTESVPEPACRWGGLLLPLDWGH